MVTRRFRAPWVSSADPVFSLSTTTWQQGRADEIRAYCETDVVNTWLMYCRFRLMRGELDGSAYEAEISLVRETLSSSDAPHWKEYLQQWDQA